MPGQATGCHDHDVSGVGLAVSGVVREDWMRHAGGHVRWHLRPDDSRAVAPGYIHRVQHLDGEPAVTTHAYSRASAGSGSTGSTTTGSSGARRSPGSGS